MTWREEQIGDCRLILGDCRDVLPTISGIGSIICDPPYENELHDAIGRIKRTDGKRMIQNLGFAGVNANRDEYARELVAAANRWLIVFCLAEGVRAWRDPIQSNGGKWDTTLAWVKPDASPRFNGQGAARGFECAISAWCGRGHRYWNGGGRRGVFVHPCNVNRQGEHPTEKPITLMLELVGLFTDHNEVVCDPFAGSGSTGIACIRLGRRFVGIESDPKWFDLACRRIEEAYRQGDLIRDVYQKPQQDRLAL